ncbi:MAG: bifunctional folylpolyglutamate synthase/dihydrofolate synthase [Deltaproteobacteria bacterium]|nr:bifunctional folylpolyglutamate synthase/dihydrofolate synthase [Deltaproteobacteria bacterium]MCL5277181.1 bifunctional folylpolyglutamate synthase/dihydrofolate synthase [Deltaproteobacteria bacterium]
MSVMDIVQRIRSLEKQGIKPGLGRICALLGRMGHPERAYRSVVVGGTNGKGSTCAMMDSVLRSAGQRTGLYTSPHLVHMRERIKTDGATIDDGSLEDTARAIFNMVQDDPALSGTTYFEFLTALALQHFKDRHVDIAVLEVGMGGRFDATNAVEPVVSTVTNIAMDHEAYLGGTPEEIAGEKAGIIRRGRPFVTTDTCPGSRAVLEAECGRRGGMLYAVERDFSVYGDESDMGFRGPGRTIEGLKLSLRGRHQLYNAGAAIQSLLLLEREGIGVTDGQIREGLLKTVWHGRFETIHGHPDVVVDSAHNPAGIRTLVQAVKDNYSGKATIVFAASRDKDWKTMISMLREISDTFVFTSYRGERSADPGTFRDFTGTVVPDGVCRAHVVERADRALRHALDITPPDGVIVVAGSIFLVGELKMEAGL